MYSDFKSHNIPKLWQKDINNFSFGRTAEQFSGPGPDCFHHRKTSNTFNTCSPEFHSENNKERRERGREGWRGEGEKERQGWNIDSKHGSTCEVGIELLLSLEQSKDTEDRNCHHQDTIQLKEDLWNQNSMCVCVSYGSYFFE